ncbi:thiamine pyrophosphate-binding protein [Streptosporangium sp. NPDC006007]|uniref:thiamine pyrophosphate-binding protein n=1 Tax=Streptosporangium sp. NPDC006007 TaxID=3154575 RepID=UPI0033AC0C03
MTTTPPMVDPHTDAPDPRTSPFSGTAAQLLVECLNRAGVDTIFGVPGDTGVGLYDALYHRTGAVRHVLGRDERHAAAMADAYARVTNRVGVVEVSSGGGTTYVVGGLGESFAASVPILLITSDIHVSSRGTGALTEIDQTKLFSAVTKWCRTVEDPADIPGAVAEALRQAVSGRPAPVALIFPENVLDEPVRVAPEAFPAETSGDLPADRPAAEQESVTAAARALARARRPAVLAGSGVHVSQAWQALAELAEAGGIPVGTSIHGKGALSDAHPWLLGVVGANGAREYANAYLREADTVLLVGTRANATDTNSWTGPARTGPTVIAVDVCAERTGRNFPDAIRLTGDARTVLEQLTAALPEVDAQGREERRAWVAAERAAWRPAPPDAATRALSVPRLSPRQVVQVAKEVMGDCLVIADPGTPTPNVASYWDVDGPGRSVIVPRGHGPMGYAIPAAVGAAFARPGEPILSITADGSFAMSCGELETVARFGLPIIFIQLTNYSLGWIKMLQHLYEGERYFGVDPGPTDAVLVAQASGLPAARVTSLDELADALQRAKTDRTPLYLDVPVSDLMTETPPVAPWQAALDGDAQRPVY